MDVDEVEVAPVGSGTAFVVVVVDDSAPEGAAMAGAVHPIASPAINMAVDTAFEHILFRPMSSMTPLGSKNPGKHRHSRFAFRPPSECDRWAASRQLGASKYP